MAPGEGLIEELGRSSMLRLPGSEMSDADTTWLGRVFDLQHCIGPAAALAHALHGYRLGR